LRKELFQAVIEKERSWGLDKMMDNE